MSIEIFNSYVNNTSLNLYHCGTEDCAPGHFYGPAVRDHYLIHYVLKGKGIFKANDTVYKLGAGNGFLICPWSVTYYQADFKDPWSYCWVGFNGTMADYYLGQANLTDSSPIFLYNSDDHIKNIIMDMVNAYESIIGRETKQLGLLYLFLSHLISSAPHSRTPVNIDNRKDLYVKKAAEYIGMNYSRKISISEIAAYIGLDRSYLGSIFKESLGVSLQQYLINYRIDKACSLMNEMSLSVGDISRSVGYDDPLLFSKIFKKVTGQCPKDFRNGLRYT